MKQLFRYFAAVLLVGSLLLVFLLRESLIGPGTPQTAIVLKKQFPPPSLREHNLRATHAPNITEQKTLHGKASAIVPKEIHQPQATVFGALERVHDYIPSIPVGSAPPKIPHIIHQTWDDDQVPSMFASYIKSWQIRHPDWEYWFWTPVQVKQMLTTHYPEFEQMYGNYSEPIFKANLMRYFIMHKYGGVYADLDLECLRPLDNWTMDNECVMSQNHYVHAHIIGTRGAANVMITFLASRPGHPYFKLAIDMLPSYKDMKYSDKLVYSEAVYREYLKTPESQKPENSVTVTHPDYFLPTYDKGWYGKVQTLCRSKSRMKLTPIQKTVCEEMNDGTNGRQPKSFSYANHYWEHVIMWGKNKEKKARTKISDIMPKALFPFTDGKL